MSVRFPLRLKIGSFAVALVVGATAAVWGLAVWRPALVEREAREEQYSQLRLALGTSALSGNALTHPAIHPDLAYVVRRRGGALLRESSVVHPDRLAPIAPALASQWAAAPEAALEALARLRQGEVEGLVIKQVNLKKDEGDEVVALGFSTASLDLELERRLRSSLLVLAVALCAAVAGALALAARVTRPVRELAAAMDGIGKGTLEPVRVASADEVGLLARAFNDMVRGLKERERLRGTLARYVSDDVAERILTERSDLDLEGELREVTVLFLDIRGFTALSERLPPREIVSMLNEYFEAIIEVIFENHGTVNKFIGDAVMALFGAPRAIDDPAGRAVRTAVQIQRRVGEMNHRRAAAGLPTIAVGIGINTGEAIAGNIGSARRLEYTVVGDEVNLAQRLEGLAREGEILVSQATHERVSGRVDARAREPVLVKGKALPVQVFEVVGLEG